MAKWKKDSYRFWHSPFVLVFLFCILIFFGYRIIGLIEKEKETTERKELILEKIENLKTKEASLASDISKLETEDGKEEIIREKYQVAKDGEKMVIIVNGEEDSSLIKEDVSEHGFVNWLKRIFNF